MDRDLLARVANALGDVRLYEKHHTGELIAMRLRDLLADLPGFGPAEVDGKLADLAKAAVTACGEGGDATPR